MSVYPDIGFKIDKITDSRDFSYLKNNFPKKTIIRIYGFAGVGKSTLSKKIAEFLELPYLVTGYIIRAITRLYLDSNLEITENHTDILLKKLEVKLTSNGLIFFINKQEYLPQLLKNSEIDTNITKYAKDPYIRYKFDNILREMIFSSNITSLITEGRGSHEPYIVELEKKGYNIIRILVDCDLEVKAKRQLYDYRLKNPNEIFNEKEKLDIIKKEIKDRDNKDKQNILEKKLGLISDDSGVLDTANMSEIEMVNSCLYYIENKIFNK